MKISTTDVVLIIIVLVVISSIIALFLHRRKNKKQRTNFVFSPERIQKNFFRGIPKYLLITILIGVFAIVMMGIKPTVVLTGSMLPQIKPGSMILVQPVKKFEDLKVGDIITFSHGGNVFVTHRIVEIHNQYNIITRGDNNNTNDSTPVTFYQIQGKTIAVVWYAGFVLNSWFTIQKVEFFMVVIISILIPGIVFSKKEYTKHLKF